MGFRGNAKRPDIDVVAAVAEELVATSHELTSHSRNAVERSRRVRAQVKSTLDAGTKSG